MPDLIVDPYDNTYQCFDCEEAFRSEGMPDTFLGCPLCPPCKRDLDLLLDRLANKGVRLEVGYSGLN